MAFLDVNPLEEARNAFKMFMGEQDKINKPQVHWNGRTVKL